MKLTPVLFGLLCSGSAFAGAEVGLATGWNSVKPVFEGIDDIEADTGFGFGLRTAMAMDSGVAPELLVTQYRTSTEVVEGLSVTTKQLNIGVGARYNIGDGDTKPFAGAHLNYAMDMKGGVKSDDVESEDVVGENTGGMGFDAFGGVQIGIGDSMYVDVLASYGQKLANDEGGLKLAIMTAGVGFGMKF